LFSTSLFAQWDAEAELRAFTRLTRDPHFSAVGFYDTLADRQSQSGTAGFSGYHIFSLKEAVK
jgi:hypothetical protein